MANLGTAYIQIVPSAQGISGSVENVIRPEASAAGVSAGQSIASSMSSTLKSVGTGLMKAGGIATALSVPLIAGIKSSLGAYNLQHEAETKLTEIYKTRMGVSDEAAKKTMELTAALQQQGVVGDEVQLAGAQQLATFAKMPSTVDSLLPAMNNLLVQQKGLNGTQQDATQIANLMGKVMMGQTGALKRVGISFDENQEKVLKYGTEQEKAAMLAQVITDNVGNMNEAFAQTDEGKIQQMNNSLGDMKEKIGGAIAPALGDLATYISDNIVPKVESFLNMLTENPALGKIALAITGILAVGGPLMALIGMIATGVGAILPILGGISAPVIAIVAGIAALVGVLVLAWQRSESFRTAVQGLGTAIMGAVMPIIEMLKVKFMEVLPIIMSLATTLGNGLGAAISFLTPILTVLINLLGVVLQAAITMVINHLKVLDTGFKAIAKVMGPPFAAATKAVSSACKKISEYLTFKNIAETASNAFKKVQLKIYNAIKTAQFNVNKTILKIKRDLGFQGLAGKVKSTFDSVKEKVTSPINKAKDTVTSAVKTIKGLFPLPIGKIFSGLKIPHFKVSGGSAPWGVGGKGSLPHWSVSWYKRGGIFDGPSIIGIGEKAPEAAIPLSGREMRPFAQAIASEMHGGSGGGDIIINLNYEASDGARDMLRDVVREVKRYKMAGAF